MSAFEPDREAIMIVCLGWGSLIWDPRNLKVKDEWKNDGPNIAVEYLRQSQDGRLTLIVNEGGEPLTVLWAEMDFQNCEEAKENLRTREGKIKKDFIGFWKSGDQNPSEIPDLGSWAESKGVDVVLWTALPPKFNGENNRKPTLEEAIKYLRELDNEKKALAIEYICKSPIQIQTPFRPELEKQFGRI